MLYKCEEWESISGWHCGCLLDLAHNSNLWYLPARILDLTPAQFIEFLITNYKPDHIYFNKESCFFSYSWDKQESMRKFKRFINAAARKKNFQI